MAGIVASLSSVLLVCVMLVAAVSGDVSFQNYALKIGTGAINPAAGALSDVNINLTAVAADSSSSQSGTSNWYMTVFGSKQDDPIITVDALSIQAQVLSQEQQDEAVTPGQTLQFLVPVRFPVGDMGGCDGDYKFFCVIFGKSDDAQPDFTLSNGYSGCVEFKLSCATDPQPTAAPTPDEDKVVVLSRASWGLNWGTSQDGDETFSFTVEFNPSSRQNLAGSNLWKLSIWWRSDTDADSSEGNYEKQDQILSDGESGLSLVNGQPLDFNVGVNFPQSKVGCGEGQYRYLCVKFSQDDNPQPDYPLGNTFKFCSLVADDCDNN